MKCTLWHFVWCFLSRDLLATGCEDKCVRVYYVASTSDQPLKVFSGRVYYITSTSDQPLKVFSGRRISVKYMYTVDRHLSDTSVPKLTVWITEYPDKWVTSSIYNHNWFPNMCLYKWIIWISEASLYKIFITYLFSDKKILCYFQFILRCCTIYHI